VATSRPAYCLLADLTDKLYASEGSDQAVTPPAGQTRVLSALISAISRRFDKETGRPPGNFAPTYDARLYSGDGFQEMDTDEYGMLAKVEINLSPGVFPAVWTDVTAEYAQNLMSARPIRFWPKTGIFRMRTLLPDPYMSGNIRLTGIFGSVQPDLGAAVPSTFAGLAPPTALQPLDPVSGLAAGWWITPEDVANACIEWAIYAYKMAQAGYGEQAGSTSALPIAIPKKIPGSVQDVISTYTSGRIHLAMIGLDGIDFREELSRPGGGYNNPGGMLTRWAGWQTT
jgi:hypothetical protein